MRAEAGDAARHGGAAEADPVEGLAGEPVVQFGGPFCDIAILVDHQLVEVRTGLREELRQHVASPAGPCPEDVLPGDPGGESGGERLGAEDLGDDVGPQVPAGEGGGGAIANGGEAEIAERTEIAPPLQQSPQEEVDPIDAGEDQPVVLREAVENGVDQLPVGGWGDLEDGHEQRVGPQFEQLGDEFGPLLGGAGNADGESEEGPPFVPDQRAAVADAFPQDQQGGGSDSRGGGEVGDGGEGAGEGGLGGGGDAAEHRGGGGGVEAAVAERAGDLREAMEPHVEDQRAGEAGQRGVVEDGVGLGGVFVTGDEGDRRGVLAVSERDAGVGPGGDGGGDAGDDFEGDARLGESGGFFAPAAEDQRVAPLEADDGLSGAGGGDDVVDDLALLEGAGGPAFTPEGANRLGAGVLQHPRAHQAVVEHEVGPLEALEPAEGEQPGVSRTGSHQVHRSHLHRRAAPECFCHQSFMVSCGAETEQQPR